MKEGININKGLLALGAPPIPPTDLVFDVVSHFVSLLVSLLVSRVAGNVISTFVDWVSDLV